MNRVGMMIDISHNGKQTMLQAVALSKSPVIASHSGVRALAEHARNLDDEQLDAIKKNGGVVQCVALGAFVKDTTRREGESRIPPANVQDFVNHIDYVVKRIGIDHAGISSDFDGGGGLTGWQDASQTFNVTLELVRRGYSAGDIEKIWGGNLVRVWKENERVAKEMQAKK